MAHSGKMFHAECSLLLLRREEGKGWWLRSMLLPAVGNCRGKRWVGSWKRRSREEGSSWKLWR